MLAPELDRLRGALGSVELSMELAPDAVTDVWPCRRIYVNMIQKTSDHFDDVERAVAASMVPAIAHVPASRFASIKAARRVLERLERAGAEGCLLVGGNDLNSSRNALALVPLCTTKTLAFAGFPEGHPALDFDKQRTMAVLRTKCRAALETCDVVRITSQFTFDSETLEKWLDDVRCDLGPLFSAKKQLRIDVGIPGPTPRSKLHRIAQLCNVSSSQSSSIGPGAAAVEATQEEDDSDLVYPTEQLLALAAYCETHSDIPEGQICLHFYPFGGVPVTLDLIRRLHNTN